MRAFLLCLIAIASLGHVACAGEPFVVAVERDTAEGLEQLALIFSDKTVELVTNSNFFSTPTSSAQLGRFVSPLTAVLSTRRNMLEAAGSEPGATLSHDRRAPASHRPRFYIGESELAYGSLAYKVANETLERIWRRADWTAVKSATFNLSKSGVVSIEKSDDEKSGGAKTSRRQATSRELGCRSIASRSFVCPSEYGQAYLRLPK